MALSREQKALLSLLVGLHVSQMSSQTSGHPLSARSQVLGVWQRACTVHPAGTSHQACTHLFSCLGSVCHHSHSELPWSGRGSLFSQPHATSSARPPAQASVSQRIHRMVKQEWLVFKSLTVVWSLSPLIALLILQTEKSRHSPTQLLREKSGKSVNFQQPVSSAGAWERARGGIVSEGRPFQRYCSKT